jgi:multidrug transporter EmrE-like cation transporter
MTLRSLFLVFLSAGITVAANLLVRMGVLRSGGFVPQNFGHILEGLGRLIRQPTFDIGMILYGLASLLWFRIVSSEQLTIAYPILVSLTFLMVTVGGYFLFRESISPLKVAGMMTIVVGIALVSYS